MTGQRHRSGTVDQTHAKSSGTGLGPHVQTVLLNGSYAKSLIAFRGKMIQEMLKRGHKVHVSAPDIEPETARALDSLGAIVHDLPLSRLGRNPLGDFRYAYSLWKLMGVIRPDRVIGYTIKPNIWGSIAARLRGVNAASMVTGLGFAFGSGGGWRQYLLRSVSQKLYRFAVAGNDKVVFQNPDDIRDFICAGCLSDAQKAVMVNGSGVDINHFCPVPLPEAPVFLMISRFLVSKGVREYIQAVPRVLAEYPDCKFLLVGFADEGVDGVPQTEVESWMRSGITNLGHLEDVRPAIAQASVYVLPSYREGTPRTVLEAMAMGRAVITTDVPGCRETVTNFGNGFLVEVRNADSLAIAMRTLAASAALRTKMGAESRKTAVEKYAVDSVNNALLGYLGL
jgi:glycosyltransferase involved in cell wall biosynthesis